jgi:hypothetical protein
MKTKLFGVAALALLTTACGQGNLYPMPVDQAYAKLLTAKLPPSGKTGPFYKLPIVVTGDGASTVRWKIAESDLVMCEANVTAEGADKSRVNAYCGGGGEGAAAGISQAMTRSALIELIDATLRGRPYDQQLAMGSTASGWPKDPRQADSSYAGAAAGALKMERDMRRDIKEMEQADAQDRAEAAERAEQLRSQQPVTYDPSKPTSDISH